MVDFRSVKLIPRSLFDEKLNGRLTLTVSDMITPMCFPGTQIMLVAKQGQSLSKVDWERLRVQSRQKKEKGGYCFLSLPFLFCYSLSPPQSKGSCVVLYCSDQVIKAIFRLQATNSIQASLSLQCRRIWGSHWWLHWGMGGACCRGPLILLPGVRSPDTQAQGLSVRVHFPSCLYGILAWRGPVCVNDTDMFYLCNVKLDLMSMFLFPGRAWLFVAHTSEGSNLTPAHHYPDFRFKTYAPLAFRYFRDLFGIKPDDYLVRLKPGWDLVGLLVCFICTSMHIIQPSSSSTYDYTTKNITT